MESAALRRVQFLVTPAPWAYYEDREDLEVDLDEALHQLGDLRLVAAYVLDLAAGAARKDAAQASAGQVKRMKDGDGEMEYFPATHASEVDAVGWAALAEGLRSEVRAEGRQRQRGGSVTLDVGSSF